MKTKNAPLDIWIFNDPSVASLLSSDSPLWPEGKPSLIAEFASAPTIALALDLETPQNYPGAPGLLGPATAVSELSVRLPDCGIPAILAPSWAPPAALWAAALRLLAQHPDLGEHRIVLVEASLFSSIAHALTCARSINWIWDLAIPPSAMLEQIQGSLNAEDLAGTSNWQRFVAYFGQGHQPNEDEIAEAKKSLAELPKSELLLGKTPLDT